MSSKKTELGESEHSAAFLKFFGGGALLRGEIFDGTPN